YRPPLLPAPDSVPTRRSSDLAPTTGLRVVPQHPCLSFRLSEAGLRPANESRNPVIKAVRRFTPAMDYWVPARASPVEPGSLGRRSEEHTSNSVTFRSRMPSSA